MSVYIRGLEMPESCFYCPMRVKVDPDTIKCLATGERFEETFAGTIEMRNRGNCPLVPVPPHGRLIDADALAMCGKDCYGCPYDSCMLPDIVMEAPTIIPADKEDGE